MKAFALLIAAGFVALLLAVVAGFEEADGTLLLVAAIFLLAAPAVFLQVMIARDLTRDQKRAWLRALTGRRALLAWSACLRRPHVNRHA
jgi:hypothetical protein